MLRLNLPQFKEHVNYIFFTFTHTDDPATADFKTNSLKHADILYTLLKRVCTADIMIIRTTAVQIMIDPVQTGFPEHSGLFFCQKPDRTAKMRSMFFHPPDPAGKFLDLFIRKLHPTQTDTMSG